MPGVEYTPTLFGEICVASEMHEAGAGPLRVIERVEGIGDVARPARLARQRSHGGRDSYSLMIQAVSGLKMSDARRS